jgi:transketolase
MERRLLDITYSHKLSHLGSCLTALPIIDRIYRTKGVNDIFILSSGHAGLALYVVLEKYEGRNAEQLLEKHGIHPSKDPENGIWASSGSLGSAILVAVGYALGDKNRDVHVLISDGECAEGSVWEALAFAHRKNLKNLKVHVNINGYSAYDAVNQWNLFWRLKSFNPCVNVWFTENPTTTFMNGLNAHYVSMSEKDKDEMLGMINEKGFCVTPLRCYEKGFKDFSAYCRSGLWNFGSNTKRLSRQIYERWFI